MSKKDFCEDGSPEAVSKLPLAPEGRRIIAGGSLKALTPGKSKEEVSPEGAREYIAFRPFRAPPVISKTGGSQKALAPGYYSIGPPGLTAAKHLSFETASGEPSSHAGGDPGRVEHFSIIFISTLPYENLKNLEFGFSKTPRLHTINAAAWIIN